MVILSTMKASRFVKAFEREVDRWERQLSQVLEVIETILTVQRQWIYLEVRETHSHHRMRYYALLYIIIRSPISPFLSFL